MLKKLFILVLVWFCLNPGLTARAETCVCDNNTNNNTNTSSTARTTTYATAVIINEILPNPSGDESQEEFIELYNTSSSTVDLTDWQLTDATDNGYTLAGSIGAKQYLVVYRAESDIALNNSGDQVRLFHPNGNLTDNIEYVDSAKDDTGYALTTSGDWQWTTTPTPGKKNSLPATTTNTNSNTNSASNTNNSNNNSNTNTNAPVVTTRTIQLSELLPDPTGSDSTDEWIELHNYGTSTVDLNGWQLADSSKTYTISTSTPVPSNGYVVFWIGQTGLS
ncbi:MAG: lamin tail domain-containing protein, partial [Patescibacteria group bacterium]